jgi:UPF0755 protein
LTDMGAQVWLKRVMIIVLVVLALAGIKAFDLYRKAFAPNIYLDKDSEVFLYIETGWDYEKVMGEIAALNVVNNMDNLKWAAKKKNYPNHIYPGRYQVQNRMNNNEFINMLRSGKQEPVKLTFNSLRTLDEFCDRISEQLELNADELYSYLTADSVLNKFGVDKYTINGMFIPNTYEIYWNISVESFVDRMHREYNNFWNNRRLKKAEAIGLSPMEVVTLASIVNEETRKEDERPRVAGLYINRLNKPIRLQADPTVIYAWKDFNIRRVLRKHYQLDSPFNTYRVDGLPPGPICFPDISSIDAVLNHEKHNYLYMCAKPDFSGYHSFAKTLSEHNRNAALYRRELNKRRIYR